MLGGGGRCWWLVFYVLGSQSLVLLWRLLACGLTVAGGYCRWLVLNVVDGGRLHLIGGRGCLVVAGGSWPRMVDCEFRSLVAPDGWWRWMVGGAR